MWLSVERGDGTRKEATGWEGGGAEEAHETESRRRLWGWKGTGRARVLMGEKWVAKPTNMV